MWASQKTQSAINPYERKNGVFCQGAAPRYLDTSVLVERELTQKSHFEPQEASSFDAYQRKYDTFVTAGGASSAHVVNYDQNLHQRHDLPSRAEPQQRQAEPDQSTYYRKNNVFVTSKTTKSDFNVRYESELHDIRRDSAPQQVAYSNVPTQESQAGVNGAQVSTEPQDGCAA